MITKLQRRILATLEEAGEENFTSLTNTVATPHGAVEEIHAMRDALGGLMNAGFVRIAVSRDIASLRLVPLPSDDAASLLRNVTDFVAWSTGCGYWEWKSDPIAEIVLTNPGRSMAEKVLSEDGWPNRPLDTYGE
jgi:hypothetical protein